MTYRSAKHLRIQPESSWFPLDFRELWAFRDLFVILAMRDVKLRYKQTILGVVWVILQPLVASLIFAIIFGRIASLPSDGKPYLLFVYAGMLPWNIFAGSLQRAGNSLISDAKLITKVYFPRLIIPIASSAAVLIDFAVAFVVMLVLLVIYHEQAPLTWNFLALPFLLLIVLLVSIGVSLFLSALNVYYRDFMYALPFVVQVWMYASPLVYSVAMIPDRWRVIYALNPMTGIIDGFRWALLGTGAFPWLSMSLSILIGCLFFLGGAYTFQRVESRFADVV
jgi:lipopolysaccharide transport system permease protein